jgi:uncharacterized membrane protein
MPLGAAYAKQTALCKELCMHKNVLETVALILEKNIDEFSEAEQQLLERVLHRHQENPHPRLAQPSLGDRVADRVASFGGSWPFIIIFSSVLICWIILNGFILHNSSKAFDPFPFILLNLVLSMVAALQAPIIMMSQNRQGAKDRLDAAHDYEVNLKAEVDILALHQKLDALRETQWKELVQLQQQQIELLQKLLEQQGKA